MISLPTPEDLAKYQVHSFATFPSDEATMELMRRACGRVENATLHINDGGVFAVQLIPVSFVAPSAINGLSAEGVSRLLPRLDSYGTVEMVTRLGEKVHWQRRAATIRADVLISMRSQRDDYLAAMPPEPGLPNRVWGYYLSVSLLKLHEVRESPGPVQHTVAPSR